MWSLDSVVQIIKCCASLPDKTEPQGSQHNKAQHPRWLECNVPFSCSCSPFWPQRFTKELQCFFFAFPVKKKTKRPFQNPLGYASASCSEIHSMVPNIYQKTALRGKKKKGQTTQRGTAIYWQTHKIEQKEKHFHYSLS